MWPREMTNRWKVNAGLDRQMAQSVIVELKLISAYRHMHGSSTMKIPHMSASEEKGRAEALLKSHCVFGNF